MDSFGDSTMYVRRPKTRTSFLPVLPRATATGRSRLRPRGAPQVVPARQDGYTTPT